MCANERKFSSVSTRRKKNTEMSKTHTGDLKLAMQHIFIKIVSVRDSKVLHCDMDMIKSEIEKEGHSQI